MTDVKQGAAVADANPNAVTHANPNAVTHANPNAVTHANPNAVTHANPNAATHANPNAVTHANPPPNPTPPTTRRQNPATPSIVEASITHPFTPSCDR